MESLRSFQSIAGLAVVAMTILAVVLFTLYLRSALRPVGLISQKLEQASSGVLGTELREKGASELRSVARGLNDLLSSLKQNVSELQQSSEANRGVEQTLSATTEQNGRAIASISDLVSGIEEDIHALHRKVTESEERIERITNTLEGFETEVKEQGGALDSASDALERIVNHSKSVATTTERHRETTEALIESMAAGREEMEETRKTVEEIQSSTGAISDFLELMKSIAEQTNLLSMNAAIEAAHAGDAGSGFAVVADEIRKLAQQASQQSQEMSDVITDILQRIETATRASRQTAASFQRADEEMGAMRGSFSEVSSETEELLTEGERISSEIESLKHASQEVHRGSTEATAEGRGVREGLREVAALSRQVEQRIGEIGGATKESRASMDELRRATQALTETAGNLADASERWRIEEAE
jgi:methyl-accepting chemotaxis protein